VKRRRAAAPYAKALFALAKEGNETELDGRELGRFRTSVALVSARARTREGT
jgi:F0F1-type ATP synthase delta subunit